MAVTVTPKFISTIPNDPDWEAAGYVGTDRWNAGSDIKLDGAGRLIGRVAAGNGAAEEITIGGGLKFDSLALVLDLASTSEIRAKNATKPITMGGAVDAAAPVAKTWTGAVTVDFAEFTGALVVTGTGNVTLGAVSNAKPGTSGTFEFLHSGAARTIAVNATYWDTPGGAGLTLSTTAGQRDLLAYYVKASGKIMLTVAALNIGG